MNACRRTFGGLNRSPTCTVTLTFWVTQYFDLSFIAVLIPRLAPFDPPFGSERAQPALFFGLWQSGLGFCVSQWEVKKGLLVAAPEEKVFL
jgi:hypothetical protein